MKKKKIKEGQRVKLREQTFDGYGVVLEINPILGKRLGGLNLEIKDYAAVRWHIKSLPPEAYTNSRVCFEKLESLVPA